MSSSKGISSFPHILTEADVMLHSYGAPPDAEQVPSVIPAAPSPEPVVEIPPPPPSPDDLSDAELAEKLERENTKAALVTMAETAGIDQSGNKTELSARLVAHYRQK